MKKLPIGRDNFKDIIEGDFYYVDKTRLIEELLERGTYIALFPRPRRFGKSLTISTIDEFFNVEKKDINKSLFKGLYISKSKYSKEQGKYPVINLNFKSLKSENWEHMYATIKEEIRELFESKRYVLESLNDEQKNLYFKFLRKEASRDEYEKSIKILSQFMEKYYQSKVVLLIDEYDVPIQTGYTKGFYNDIIGFIKNLFGNALKTNDSVKISVMTGILRVSKESIFSDLNNVDIYTTIDKQYDEYFGFNEKETSELLEHFNLELTQEVKSMYDGYIFGTQEIYNPWSIINYANRRVIGPYWVNTSADELLRQLFENSRKNTTVMLEKLILGKSIDIKYNEKITFLDLDGVKSGNAVNVIGNFLLFSGYLTKADKSELNLDRYIKVKIPNNEVRVVYTDVISNFATSDAKFTQYNLYELKKNILKNDKEEIEKILNEALQSMSFMDEHENFYHGYMLGLFVNFLTGEYIVKSNREAGEGRFDIMIESVDRKVGIVIEFKLAREENLLEKAEEGKRQIKEKKYYKELELDRVENILTYCIAFRGKLCKVV